MTSGTIALDPNSLKELEVSNQKEIEKLRNDEELAKRREATILNKQIKDTEKHLPSINNIRIAMFYSIFIADGLGWIPYVGEIIDVISVFLLSSLLKTGLISKRNMIYLPEILPLELIPVVGSYIQMLPFYTFGVFKFYFDHKSEYGSLKQLIGAKKGLGGGVYQGTAVNLGSTIIFLLLFLLPACTALAMTTSQPQTFNPVGESIVSYVPLFSAFKQSGRIEHQIDSLTVSTLTFDWDPFKGITDLLNKSTAIAGGNYYTGEIEDTKDLNLGFNINGLEPFTSYAVGDEISFSYFVEGGTFVDTEQEIETYCYLKKPRIYSRETQITGTTQPKRFPVIKDLPVYQLITCDGINTDGLEAGAYQLVGGITYDFEVWSYIPYTFVSRSTFEAYGKEINNNLGINKQTTSLNTNGPEILTISSLASTIPQPYVVYDDRETNFVVNFKLENNGRGKLKSLDYVMLQIPKEFEPSCAREEGKWETDSPSGYNYLFNQLIGQQADSAFLDDITVIKLYDFSPKELENDQINFRCSLKLPPHNDFLSLGPQTKKTIVATAKYTYDIKQVITMDLQAPVVS